MRVYASSDDGSQLQVRGVPDSWREDHRVSMSERELQDNVIELAGHLKYLHYHTHNSQRSVAGFPDLVLVNPARRRTLFVELKAMTGRLSQAQSEWLVALAEAGHHVHLWTPVDWVSGVIERELRGPRI